MCRQDMITLVPFESRSRRNEPRVQHEVAEDCLRLAPWAMTMPVPV